MTTAARAGATRGPVARLVVSRLASGVPLVLGVALVVFCLFNATGVDPAAVILGEGASAEARAAVARELGLDRPLPERFGDWIADAARGDLGDSYTSREPVTDIIARTLPVTLALVAGGMLIAVVLGVAVGVVAGIRPGSLVDRGLTIVTSVLLAIPGFWLALLLVLLLALQWGVLPSFGYTRLATSLSGWLDHMALPWMAIGLHGTAVIARHTRSAMIEALQSGYVRGLRLRGVPFARVVRHYALRNALVPIVAIVGVQTSVAFGSSFVVEQVFSIPGMGTALLHAVLDGDIPTLQGGVLVVAVGFLLLNLLLDIVYGLLNPQVRPE